MTTRETAPGRPAAGRTAPWDPAARHRFVTGDGTALYVVDEGMGRRGEPAVVLVHGWTLDHTLWDAVAAGLPAAVGRPLRVLRFDLRGHGGSAPAPRGTATIARVADDLAELLAARVPDGPIVLVGHSMGGMAIMALAERHPELAAERVTGIGLVSTSSGGLRGLSLGLPRWLARPVMGAEARVRRRLARLDRPVLLTRPGIARPGLRWLLFGARPDRADVVSTAAQVGRCHPASMAGFRRSLDEHERRTALAAWRGIPAVVCAGGVDRLTALSHARRIADELPDADFVIYPKAGHMLPMERGAEVTARIARLLPGA